MKKEKISIFLFMTLFLLIFHPSTAQDDYKYEVGGMLGTSFYMGDANKTSLYKNAGLAGGLIFRYNYDLRWSLKTNLAIGHVSGDTRGSSNAYPYSEEMRFSRNFYEVGSQMEFNFFNYSDKFGYLGAKRMTPYIFAGIGVTMASGERAFSGYNFPFGVGLKYKIKERVNLGFEFSFRKLFSDSFDTTNGDLNAPSLDNPYEIKSSTFKNKDWYSLTMITLTWDFGARICPCLNVN